MKLIKKMRQEIKIINISSQIRVSKQCYFLIVKDIIKKNSIIILKLK